MSRGWILSSNRSSNLRTSKTVTVGDSLPLATTWMPSGAVLMPCGLLRDRDIARVGRTLAAVEDRHAADLLEVAALHRLLDALEVEDDDPVLLLGHHLGQGHAFLRVVAGRRSILALVVGIDVVEVAVDHDLPGDLHRVAVDGGEDRAVLLRIVEDLAVVRDRHAVLAVAEDVAGARDISARAGHAPCAGSAAG